MPVVWPERTCIQPEPSGMFVNSWLWRKGGIARGFTDHLARG